jgi:hypothetical protein
MKKILEKVWEFLVALGEAHYAAKLARNGRVEEAKRVYQND